MTNAMLNADAPWRDLSSRDGREGHRAGALAFSIGVHAAFFALMWVGVAWKTSEPATVEAELWSSLPQFAAPAPVQVPVPEPEPVVVQPPPREPEPDIKKAVVPDPEIALARERERQQQKREAEQREQELKQREEKIQEEQRKRELAQKQAAAKLAEKKAADERINAVTAALIASAGAPGTGSDKQNSGPRGSATYQARVSQLIRSNTVYPAGLTDENPTVEFAVKLDPAGGIMSLRMVRSSGLTSFDDAVAGAIRKTEPFPPDGARVPSELNVVQRLKQ